MAVGACGKSREDSWAVRICPVQLTEGRGGLMATTDWIGKCMGDWQSTALVCL
jgi:hypothetical protein